MGWLYENGDFEALMLVGCFGGGGGSLPNESDNGYPPHVGSGGSKGGVSAPTPAQIAEALQRQIDGSKLDACSQSVLEALKNSKNCDIANVFTKLGVNKVYNLKLVSGYPIGGIPASTTRTYSNVAFDYTITISKDYTSATSLFRASNMLHEIVHAYFMSLKDDQTNGGGSAVYGEFPVLFQAYCDSKYPPNKNEAANAHHEEMANQYVNAIALALQEYNLPNDPNKLVPYQVYSDLAWAGLSEAPVFDENFKGKEEEKERVLNRYRCESNGSVVEAGSPKQQNPIGKPCTK